MTLFQYRQSRLWCCSSHANVSTFLLHPRVSLHHAHAGAAHAGAAHAGAAHAGAAHAGAAHAGAAHAGAAG